MTEKNGAKLSVYVDDEMRGDLSLLASMDKQSVTALTRKIIQEYLIAHAGDIDFMRRQEQEITDYKQRRSNHDG